MLITLGVIGIVAAMTFPSIVAKYQKVVTVNQLKKVYSTLLQAIDRSVADHGEVSEWNLGSMSGGVNETAGQKKEHLDIFVNTYILPYFSKIRDVEYTSFKSIGYKQVLNLDGSISSNDLNRNEEIIILNDGTIIGVYMDNSANQGTEENPIWITTNVLFNVDINGLKNPNTIGKDIFVFMLNTKTSKFSFYKYADRGRENYLNLCQKRDGSSRHCGMLILIDGWKISDDYPW